MVKIGIPKTAYSTKESWDSFVTYLFGEDAEVVNLNPWIDNPGGEYEEGLLPENIDIVLFDGGSDIHPILYKEAKHISTHTNIVRDWTELIIFQRYLNTATKFAGICRGCQFLNIAMGGTLYQDLFSEKKGHAKFHLNDIMHDTKFHQFIGGNDIRVNSLHHQAVKDLGRNLRPIMTHITHATVEGIESKRGDKIRAVQSHPEYDTKRYEKRIEVMKWLLRIK